MRLVQNRDDNEAWSELSTILWPICIAAHVRMRPPLTRERTHQEVLARIYLYTTLKSFADGQPIVPYVWAIVRTLRDDDGPGRPLGPHVLNVDPDNTSDERSVDPLEALMQKELLAGLQLKLRANEKVLLDLLLKHGRDRATICRLLKTTPGALAVRINRLKKRILDLLEGM